MSRPCGIGVFLYDMAAPVVIVGAGFAGLATARRLGQAGHDCIVLERRERPAEGGAALALQPNGFAALAGLGLFERVDAECLRIGVAFQRSPRGRNLARWKYSDLDAPHPYIAAIARATLLGILLEAATSSGARVATGCEVTGLSPGGGGVRYRDWQGVEQEQPARWVVGADGANSRVRDAIGARLALRTGPYRYLLGISRWQTPERAALLYNGRGWADGVIPMPAGSDFWDGITAENADAVARRDFDAWRAVYRKRVPEADALLEGFSSLDDLRELTGRTQRAVPRALPSGVALAGDAAAAVHPHTGQGGNLALVDGLALGDALARGGPAEVMAYARERDRRMRVTVPMSLLTGYTFDASNLAWRAVRGAGYVYSRIPPVSRAFLRRGAGLA
jgi:2-polyprenyl-6-methoxyphenol hydroxylase-like FAD-dependent oxidoreductase